MGLGSGCTMPPDSSSVAPGVHGNVDGYSGGLDLVIVAKVSEHAAMRVAVLKSILRHNQADRLLIL